MPTVDDLVSSNDLLFRTLAYGAPKTRKTWWAAKAAEAGFNVIFLQGEANIGILKQIAPEARKRIQIIDIQDVFGRAVMAHFMTLFLRGGKFTWDLDAKFPANLQMHAGHNHVVIDQKLFDSNTVVVMDSQTALATSIMWQYALENNIDLSAADKNEWEGYRWCGQLMEWMLNSLKAFNCHWIVIGHAETYEKKKQGKDANGRSTSETLWAKIQPKSTSGPAGQAISGKFTDVLYFEFKGGTAPMINTIPDKDREGGSANLPPKLWQWDELTFGKMLTEMGMALPKDVAPSEAVKFYGPGETPNKPVAAAPVAPKATMTTPVLQAGPAAAQIAKVDTKAAVPAKLSLASLMSKPGETK